MRDAVKESRKFDRELEELRNYSLGDNYIKNQIAILEKSAKYGIQDISSLNQEFSTVSEKILKNHRKEKPTKSLLDKVALNFSSVIHIRKVSGDEDSKKPEDLMALAGSYITSGNVESAINELNKLSSDDNAALSNWLEKATNYVKSHDASDAIFKYATRPIQNDS